MTSIDWSNQLGKFKILSCLNEEQLTHFLETSSEVVFNKDDVILREGDIGKQSSLYFIGIGSVSIALSGVGENKIPIDTLGPGEFFGEMAGLDKKPRTATVIASEDCQLRKISGEKFQSLMNQNAVFASRVATVLSERVRRLIENVLAVKLKDFDEKLALTNTKLDASLKSVESQQQAAHAVFEGINTRANEVINSAERSRSRTAIVFSALGIAATALTVFLSYSISTMGQEAKDALKIANSAKEKASEFESDMESLEVMKKSFELINDRAEAIEVNLSTASEKLTKMQQLANFQRYFIRDTFNALIGRTQLADFRKSGNSPLFDFYNIVLELEDADLTEELFKRVESYLLTKKSDENTEKIIILLRTGSEKDSPKTDKQKVLSYYYLLAASLLMDNNFVYEQTLREYVNYLEKGINPIPFKKEFEPDWFEKALKRNEATDIQSKIEKIYKVWRMIPKK